jgi:murein DD-endopeptidase MepM/ murein hydrolase activator NlpD
LRRSAGAWASRSIRICTCACLILSVGVIGCASPGGGEYYRIRKGDNLYRIGLAHGVSAEEIARENGIRDVASIRVGQVIWVPHAKPGARSPSSGSASAGRGKPGASSAEARRAAREEARRASQLAFRWPLDHAQLTSRFGRRRGRPHEGIDLGARRGSPIRAAEAGKVIHSGWLGDYGRVVIVKHAGNYSTVYAHANKLYVRKGDFVDRGDRIAEVGTSGKSTGPHLHFELRKREVAQDPMLYLP